MALGNNVTIKSIAFAVECPFCSEEVNVSCAVLVQVVHGELFSKSELNTDAVWVHYEEAHAWQQNYMVNQVLAL